MWKSSQYNIANVRAQGSLNIVNADVSSSAAIASTKLAIDLFPRAMAATTLATSTGVTVLGTSNVTGKVFVPTHAVFRCTVLTSFVSAATISIGTNAASFNNILAATLLTGLDGVGETFIVPLTGLCIAVANGNQPTANVTIAASAGSMQVQVALVGYYI